MNFPQFAFNNVRRNSRAYIAYLLSSAFMVMIFFTYAVFIYHPEIQRAPMGAMTLLSMQVAAYVVFIFAIFFVLYSISAFLKSRNKEFGILMTLGAQSGQINRLVFIENMMVGTAAIVFGIVGGLLLSKMFLLFSAKMIAIQELAFYWPMRAVMLTVSCFLALFVTISLFTLLFIRKNRVLELLKGSSSPKRAPKVSIWFSLLGIIMLAIAFVVLQQWTMTPKVLFIAACSGIAGTYFFYSQLSVLIIRLLQRNRKRVWRSTNLLWISELSYKLKDNARMLFLVTIVTSIACISAGFVLAVDDDNKERFLNNKFAFSYNVYDSTHIDAELATIEQFLQNADIEWGRYPLDFIAAGFQNVPTDPTKSSAAEFMRASQFHELVTVLELDPLHQLSKSTAIAVYADPSALPGESLLFEGIESNMTVVQEINLPHMLGVSYAGVIIIVEDSFFDQIAGDFPSRTRYLYHVPDWTHIPSSQDEQSSIGRELHNWKQKQMKEQQSSNHLTNRSDKYWSTKDTTSVFRFIGIFIALIFSISMASFLYFKLYTELSADSQTYYALSKIGLSSKEMSAVATKQIAFIFFSPILISTVQTLIVLKPILAYMKITNVYPATITVALAFLLVQTIYFVMARSRYVKHLEKIMI